MTLVRNINNLVDVSDNTNLAAGGHLTLTDDTLSVDDDFLLNTGDTGAGGYTLNGGLVVNEVGADVDFRVETATTTHALFVDGATDNVGIHTTTPEARLHLPAGSATALHAPLKFTLGTLLATPEAGTMEFDGTGIYLTPTNHRRFISLASDSIIATVTATTVAATTLWTGITNADELKAQRVYVIKGCGLVNNASAAGVVTITVNLGATVLVTLDTPASKLTNDPWHFEIFFTIRTVGVAGTISAFGAVHVTGAEQHTVTTSTAVNTTVASNATVKAAWNGENASNWITLTQCWMATAD